MKIWENMDYFAIGTNPETNASSLALSALLKDVLSHDGQGHICEIAEEGPVARSDESDPILRIHDFLLERGGRLFYKFISRHGNTVNNRYIWEDGCIEVNGSTSYLVVGGASKNEALLRELKELLKGMWRKPEKTGQIYAIIRQGMGLVLHSLGNAAVPLVAGNYTPKVMDDYRYAISDLKSASPSGRIVIMEGKPGTGKTHLVRAMLLEVPDAMFVLVSPEVITTLAGPELLPLLISHRNRATGPIVLVLEDADRCLVTRGDDNMSSIQSLLNLGDGILGSMLDLRIVATTNANKLEMEAAILRPGRLSRRLEVGALDRQTATNIFKRLLPNSTLPEQLSSPHPHVIFSMTLAEVYALARSHGWVPSTRDADEDEELEDDD